jgi:hypothetical protein
MEGSMTRVLGIPSSHILSCTDSDVKAPRVGSHVAVWRKVAFSPP